MSEQNFANGLCVDVDACDSADKVPAVALEEHAVFFKVVVFVIFTQDVLEQMVVSALRIEDSSSTHDIGVTGKDFGQTRNNYVCMGKDVYVEKVANGLVDDNGKVVLVGKATYTDKIGSFEKGVAGEFAKEGEEAFAAFKSLFQVIEVAGFAEAVEESTGTEFLEDFEGVDVGEAEADALFLGADFGTGHHERAVGVEDGAHAAGVEVYIVDTEAFCLAGPVLVVWVLEGLVKIGVLCQGAGNAPADGEFCSGGELHVQIATKSLLDKNRRVSLGLFGGIVTDVSVFAESTLVAAGAFLHARHLVDGGFVNHGAIMKRLFAELCSSTGDAVAGMLPESFCCRPVFLGVDDSRQARQDLFGLVMGVVGRVGDKVYDADLRVLVGGNVLLDPIGASLGSGV